MCVCVCVCVFIACVLQIHKELEEKIAAFHDKEGAVLYASCNACLFEVFLGEQDAVFSDQLNHSSIIDGICLAKTRKLRYSRPSLIRTPWDLLVFG